MCQAVFQYLAEELGGCRQGWEGASLGVHEWVQGLMGTFQEAEGQERQARQDHTFQGTGNSQQTLMGTHVIKALQVSTHVPLKCCSTFSNRFALPLTRTEAAMQLLSKRFARVVCIHSS